MKKILTAREQFDMLSPWLIVAAPKQLDLFGLGGGSGHRNNEPPMDFSPKEIGPKEAPGPRPKKKPLSKPLPATPDDTQLEAPYWQGNDWRTGDGGKFFSDVRPQIPEVDVPHPSEYMSPKQWERQKAKLKEPDYDPHGVLPEGVWFEDLVQSEMSHLNNHTAEEGYEGRGWYPGAHAISKNLSDKVSGDHERTVAEWAAVSPNNWWDNNVENGYQFGLMYPGRPGKPYEETAELYGDPALVDSKSGPVFPMPALGPSVADAQRIRHAPGKSFMDYLTGPKRQSFFRNIMDKTKIRETRPGHHPVDDANHYEHPVNPFTGERDWRMHPQQIATMDTQHHRMTLAPHGTPDEVLASMEYKTEPWFGKKRTIDGPNGRRNHEVGYELQHRAHWEAVRRYNAAQKDPQKHINPSQGQAIAWLKFRNDIDRAVEKITGKKPRVPGALPKGVEPGRWPQKLVPGSEGPEEEYFATGERAPLQDSAKGYHYPRFQRDHSYDGDPDYDAPPNSPGPDSRYLELSDKYDTGRPQKKLPGRRPTIPGTESEATPNDPRNWMHDLRRMRNWDRRAQRFWQAFREIRLEPGKDLDFKSLRIRENKDKPFQEVPIDRPTKIYTTARLWQKYAVEDWNAVEDHIRGQQYPGLTLRNELGDAPTSGYMVSLPGHEQVRPYDEKALARGDKNNVWTSDVPMSAETLQQFNTDKNQVISSDPDNKQGGWEDDGDWFDDVSRHYTDIYDAAKQAYGETPEEAQHGFYDIKNEISPSPLEFIHKGEPAFFMARRLWKG